MKTLHIKLLEDFCDDVFSDKKTFEIRKNDRDYQVGDHVIFHAVDDDGLDTAHAINGKEFEITYALIGWGLQDGYIALAIKEIKK